LTKHILNPAIWDDYRHYAINVLTLATGIRISEVRGLLVDQVHGDYIAVQTAWTDRYGLKEPKWGSCRDIPITPKVYDVLQKIIDTTKPQTLMFYSSQDYNRPMAKSHIEKKLYNALHNIGIDEKQRKERNLTFHSHRHTLNTILRSAGVNDAKIRMITGHRQEAMTDHYTHFKLNDFSEVAKATECFL
jgi:integrase